MAVNLSPVGGVAGQFFDNNGDPLVGGKLYTYSAGTTTPQTTYTSSSGGTPNSNPIILNAGGRVPAEIWLTDGLVYKFVLYSSTDQLIGSWDNIVGINSNFVNFVTSEEVQTATAGQTVFTLTTMSYQPGLNNLVVYVDGVNQVEGGSYSFVETNSTTVTFTSGLHLGAVVKFVSAETLTTVGNNAALVAYEPAGAGAVTTTVQAKLRETVSVKDFGAVGDGVTDDTAAIQAAIDSLPASVSSGGFPAYYTNGGGTIHFPEGTYLVSSPITITHNVTLEGDGSSATVIKASGNIDVIQIAYKYAVIDDYSVFGASVRNLKIDGATTAEAGITNRTPTGASPISNSVFENLVIQGAKVGMHWFGGWNNTFRNIKISAFDRTTTVAEGLFGVIGETTSTGNTYGPAGHTVVANNPAGGFNNNIFDKVVCSQLKRGGVYVRAISTSHAYANLFLNCNLEAIRLQSIAYAPYTDTSVTPEGFSTTTLKWSGQPVGLLWVGRIASFGVNNCYLEEISDPSVTTGGIGIVIDDAGITFGAPTFGSKAYQNTISNNFFNANVQRPVLIGRGFLNKIDSNAVLVNSTDGGYFFDSNSLSTLLINEDDGNVNASSSNNFSFLSSQAGLTLNNAIKSTAFATINTGAAAGLDVYRDGSTAMFDAIRFRDGTNANTLSKLGFNGNTMRLEAVASFDYYINNARVLFLDATRIFPNPDDTLSLGTVGNRWTTVYATTPTINTSDEREKQDIAELDDVEKRVAVAIKGLIKKFKFKSAVEKKGSDARIHVGVIAQEVKQAFEAEGLDAHKYGILCYDEWDAEVDENGVEIKPAGNRYGVRYEELLAFVISAM